MTDVTEIEQQGAAVVSSLDINQIKQMIPHRYPFLLIDKVIEIDQAGDGSAVGIKNVTINEPFFVGHFPDHPVMPGVLIIEAMAQTAAVYVVNRLGENAHGSIVYFMTVDKAKFRAPVTPGDSIRLHVEVIRKRGPVWKFKGEATVDGTVVAEAEFAAMIKDA